MDGEGNMKKEVYDPSTCLVSQIAYQYYIEEKKTSEIAHQFELSPSTVSRVLKRARQEGIIKIHLAQPYQECNEMEKYLEERFRLRNVCIVPLNKPEEELQDNNVKKQVALEGARYVQRIIRDDDILGLAWGGTMYHLIQYLNPCRKVRASIVTMHGSIANCHEALEVQTLVDRAAMAFGGEKISLEHPGLYDTPEECRQIAATEECRNIFEMYEKIDIALTGVGSMYPDYDSLLGKTDYLTEKEKKELKEERVVSDIMLHFIRKDGSECDNLIKNRTLAIDLETFRKIPCKVVAASGSKKAYSILSLLNGNYIDVLIIDYHLAKKLIRLLK